MFQSIMRNNNSQCHEVGQHYTLKYWPVESKVPSIFVYFEKSNNYIGYNIINNNINLKRVHTTCNFKF